MKIKGRTILVLCLLLFGGYALYDFYNQKSVDEREALASRLMTVNFEQVDQVVIEKDGQPTISLKRTVDGWNLEAPLKDQADNTIVDDFVKGAYPERIIEVAKEGEGLDWSMYGLDQPAGKITLKTSAGTQNVFEISGKRNFEDNVFVRRDGENRVLVVNSVWQNRLNKSAMEFRDRRFLRHKIASVDQIRLKNEKGLLEVQRIDGKWLSPKNKDLALDQNKVRELLTAIADAKGSDLLEGPLPAHKSLFTLDLLMADKKWLAEVGQTKDMGIYAHVSEPEQNMKMEPGALDKFISLTLADLEEKPPEKEK